MERDHINKMTYFPVLYTMWELKWTKSDLERGALTFKTVLLLLHGLVLINE